MGEDLLSAVYDEYQEWKETEGNESPAKRSKSMNDNRDGSRDGDFKQTLDVEECDPGFAFRPKLLGEKGRNVHHIQDQTGAKLWLTGNAPDPMSLEISAESAEKLEQAVSMAKDLIQTVYDDYDVWLEEGGVARRDSRSSDDRRDS